MDSLMRAASRYGRRKRKGKRVNKLMSKRLRMKRFETDENSPIYGHRGLAQRGEKALQDQKDTEE